MDAVIKSPPFPVLTFSMHMMPAQLMLGVVLKAISVPFVKALRRWLLLLTDTLFTHKSQLCFPTAANAPHLHVASLGRCRRGGELLLLRTVLLSSLIESASNLKEPSFVRHWVLKTVFNSTLEMPVDSTDKRTLL